MTPRRKDVEPLARERIVQAAMKIIDGEGLDALSMRRLGAELGVNPMAAYYHVPNKSALYDLILEAVMAGVDMSAIDPAAPLAEQLKQAARAYRAALLAHPRAIPVLATRSVRTAAALRPIEPILGILFAAALTPNEAMAAVDCVAQYILGGAVGYYHHTFDEGADEQREFEPLDAAELPNLSRMIAEARYVGDEAEFEFGLDAIVRGLMNGPRYVFQGVE
jgi:TetR/AcrR family transcriptional regulator, tetracycline repressor protein